MLLEAGLQIGSFFVGYRPVGTPNKTDRRVILVVGDSNVYGWNCTAEEAYPGRLQSYLESRVPGRYQIINLGLPGMNSSEVADRLDGWIEKYRPEIIIITVGVNNGWIRGVSTQSKGPNRWVEDLRTYRLYRLIRTSFDPHLEWPQNTDRPTLEKVENDHGFVVEQRDSASGELLLRHQGNPLRKKPYTLSSALEILNRDLMAIFERTRENRIRLALLTYAGFQLDGRPSQLAEDTTSTNETMRRFAEKHHLELVDLRDRFSRLLPPKVPREELFLSNIESHPNPRGYREIMLQVVADLDLLENNPKDRE